MSELNPEKNVPGAVDGDKDEKVRLWAAISFVVVIIGIGVPMWWKTTEVYRVALPYSGIENLAKTPLRLSSNVGIFTHDREKSKRLIEDLGKYFRENDLIDIRFSQIIDESNASLNARTPDSLEKQILKKFSNFPGNFCFIEWEKLTDEDVLMTSDRSAFISKHITSQRIQQVLSIWILQDHKLKAILGQVLTDQGTKYRPKSTAPHPQYDILISILNPQPDRLNVRWNVKDAIENYISPFLQSINALSNFTVKSQWKYQVPLEIPKKQILDDSILGRHYSLPEDYLPQIITSVEKSLGNPISDNPCIHLVVYVPPCSDSPLYIYTDEGTRSTTNDVNAFISPKWGGIVISNPPMDNCKSFLDRNRFDERLDITIKSSDVMQILLQILRTLIDIEVDIPLKGASIVPLEKAEARQWELDAYMRAGAVYLIDSATNTLESLVQLLGKISNIVIDDNVGKAINEAYESVVLAKEYLRINELEKAVVHAKIAFVAAETAFFDPSLLALLYFPDDQKYAIYVPLYLPIIIPVVMSILSIYKNVYKKKKPKTE